MNEKLKLPPVFSLRHDSLSRLKVIVTDLLVGPVVERVLLRRLACCQFKQEVTAHDKDKDVPMIVLERAVLECLCGH